jgi:hypothetical protein
MIPIRNENPEASIPAKDFPESVVSFAVMSVDSKSRFFMEEDRIDPIVAIKLLMDLVLFQAHDSRAISPSLPDGWNCAPQDEGNLMSLTKYHEQRANREWASLRPGTKHGDLKRNGKRMV